MTFKNKPRRPVVATSIRVRQHPVGVNKPRSKLNRWDLMMLTIAASLLLGLVFFVIKPARDNYKEALRLAHSVRVEILTRDVATQQLWASASGMNYGKLENEQLSKINKACYKGRDLQSSSDADELYVAHKELLASVMEQCAAVGRMAASSTYSADTLDKNGQALLAQLRIAINAEKDQRLAAAKLAKENEVKHAQHTAAAMQVWVANH